METEGILHRIHNHLQGTIESLSTLNQTRGEAIYKSGSVLLCELFVESEKSCRVDAKVQGSIRTPYHVVLRFDADGKLTDRFCNCPAYAKSGVRGKKKSDSICKHCASVLYLLRDDMKSCRITGDYKPKDPIDDLEKLLEEALAGEPVKVRTDLYGARMIEKFEREANVDDMLALVPHGLSVVPSLTFDRGDRFYLEFTVGNGRQYIVRDALAMGRAWLNRGMIEFGKGLSVLFTPECFDEESRNLLDFAAGLAEYDRQYAGRINATNLNTAPDSRRIFLPTCEMGRFARLFDGRTISYHGLRENVKNITIHDEIPPVNFLAEKAGEGIVLSHDLPTFRIMEDSVTPSLVVITNRDEENADLYYCTGRTSEILASVLEAFKRNSNQNQLQFSADAQSKLRRYVLPRIKSINRLESRLQDSRGSKNKIKLETNVYIDRVNGNQEYLTAGVKFTYGDYTFDAYAKEASLSAARIPRDIVGEMKILYLLKEKGFYSDANGNLVLMGDEKIYDFLLDGMAAIKAHATLYVTDAVKNIGIHHPKTPNVKIKLNGGLLEVSVGGDLPLEKIGEILAAYREKKKYYRLGDGSFLTLDEKNVGLFAELEKNFDLDEEKLAKKEMTFLAYRGMYLNTLLSKFPDVEVSGNKSFKLLTGNRENSDFETPLASILREYQKNGVRWLKGLADFGLGGILADEMGLGKTIQIISLLSIPQEKKRNKPSVIVAPTSLVYNWKTEFERFAPEMAVTVISGSVAKRKELLKSFRGEVLITSYDAIKRDLELYEKKQFRYCIIDEAQYIKNQTTQAATSVKAINAEVRFALTGTPVENSLADLWSIFDFVLPGFLYSYPKFRRKYEIPIVKDNDTETAEALRDQVKPFILRRTKSEVLKELPDKIESTVYVEMDEEQRNVYLSNLARARSELEDELERVGFEQSRIKILSLITRLRHLCCHPALTLEGYEGGSAKLDLCMELVRESLEEGHKVLIFSQFVSMLNLIGDVLNEEGIRYYLLKGDTPSEERMRLVQEFNKDETPIFLISLRAGGTGLNLTSADVVIHYDPWWNISVQNQATDRAHRIGQEKNVQVFKLLVKDSIEDKIFELQHHKESISRAVITESETFVANMDKDDMLELFRE
ncbi:MAG: hypothetical protein E7428_01450 [Ruminococcaceae bacterium]|nr:hypothetical protein [Oscillospiraceae bacterium]